MVQIVEYADFLRRHLRRLFFQATIEAYLPGNVFGPLLSRLRAIALQASVSELYDRLHSCLPFQYWVRWQSDAPFQKFAKIDA